jgi:hypothetical protein
MTTRCASSARCTYKARRKIRTDNPEEIIISKDLYRTSHLNKPLPSQTAEWAPEVSQSFAKLPRLAHTYQAHSIERAFAGVFGRSVLEGDNAGILGQNMES